MPEPIEELEQRIDRLRVDVRRATASGDRAAARALRTELRRAELAWEQALADLEQAQATTAGPRAARVAHPLQTVREQVHEVLTLLGGPAAPKLIGAVDGALFGGGIVGARLTSLRRDEERSFRLSPYARPYYLCAALASDRLSPARGLLASSTWPMATRVVGPLSPRVDFLTAAINIATHLRRLPDAGPAAQRLLWRFAANIPGAADAFDVMAPAQVARAAEAELDLHRERDRADRHAAAARAAAHLSDAEQLFGVRLGAAPARRHTDEGRR